MSWVGKLFAGLIGGLIAALLASVVAGLVTSGMAEPGATMAWIVVGTFVLVLFLAVTASRTRRAWGRGTVVCALLSFGLPLAAFIFSGVTTAQVANETGSAASTIGAGLGGMIVTGGLTFLGFFLGLIFVIISYFFLKGGPPETLQT